MVKGLGTRRVTVPFRQIRENEVSKWQRVRQCGALDLIPARLRRGASRGSRSSARGARLIQREITLKEPNKIKIRSDSYELRNNNALDSLGISYNTIYLNCTITFKNLNKYKLTLKKKLTKSLQVSLVARAYNSQSNSLT